MADGCYNHIYSVLVENEQDTLGIIAYSLYKRQKIEFIQAFKTKHDREPKMKTWLLSTTSATAPRRSRVIETRPASLLRLS